MKIKRYLDLSPSFKVISCAAEIQRYYQSEFGKYRLTYLQGMILASIYFEKGKEIQPKELSNVLQASKSNISHALSMLESEKCIKRTILKRDARGMVISLTDKGQLLVKTIIKHFDQMQKKTEKAFSNQGTESLSLEIEKLRQLFLSMREIEVN